MSFKEKITIIGGGPVGSLFSIYLSKKNYLVEVFEKREDPRKIRLSEGRSINMALSHRGLRALKEVGLDEIVKEQAVPMKGRMIHDEKGNLNFQPYGETHQMIYSVSRKRLNEVLIEEAEKKLGVKFHFKNLCISVDPVSGSFLIEENGNRKEHQSEILFAADGGFSAVRNSFASFNDFSSYTEKLSHSYKELHMESGANGTHRMEPNALHIWPREKFMLIALPNKDGSFTCTLFLPDDGEVSFGKLDSKEKVNAFFQNYFPDVIPLIPDLADNYFNHPESSLVTLHCFPWHYYKTLLIGDAAHAITPFYGQGMNAGFEDCRILYEILEKNKGDWTSAFNEFEKTRKPDADAIAQLALDNFIEMRDLVAEPEFVLRKKIEARIHEVFPTYLPLYTMVTFTDLPYRQALQIGKDHDELMRKIMFIPDIEKTWETPAGWKIVASLVTEYLSNKKAG